MANETRALTIFHRGRRTAVRIVTRKPWILVLAGAIAGGALVVYLGMAHGKWIWAFFYVVIMLSVAVAVANLFSGGPDDDEDEQNFDYEEWEGPDEGYNE